jgi:hypothetical protein
MTDFDAHLCFICVDRRLYYGSHGEMIICQKANLKHL